MDVGTSNGTLTFKRVSSDEGTVSEKKPELVNYMKLLRTPTFTITL